MSDLSVVFRLWKDQSPARLRAFLASYLRFDAGAAHELVVVFNGFAEPGEARAASEPLQGVPHRALWIEEPLFDMAAYFRAARAIDSEFVCFLNGHSVALADGWLGKLFTHAGEKGIGATGATGSWESVRSSLSAHGRPGGGEATDRSRGRHGRALWRLRHRFPPFPNPHLRTNAFLLRRDLFLSLRRGDLATKEGTYLFESGRSGMTRQLLERGLRPVVVGRDGRAYDVDSWPWSHTFRGGHQRNLLVGDNRTREYARAGGLQKRDMEIAAWGGGRESDAEYRGQAWAHLAGLHEVQRYSIVSGLLKFLGAVDAVLDVGCGEGILLHRLETDACSTYVGLDQSAEAIATARLRWAAEARTREGTSGRAPDVSFVRADLAGAGEARRSVARAVPGRRFGAIVFNEVLYDVPEPRALLRAFESLLRPGGIFVVSMHATDASGGVWRAIDEVYPSLDETRFANAKTGLSWVCKTYSPRSSSRSRRARAANASAGATPAPGKPLAAGAGDRIARALVRRSGLLRRGARGLAGRWYRGLTIAVDTVNGVFLDREPARVERDAMRNLTIAGWAVDELMRGPAGQVAVELDGIATAATLVRRDDVATVLEEPAYSGCGFVATVRVSTGRHRLVVLAAARAGGRRARSRPFLLDVEGPGLVVRLDQANDRPWSGATLTTPCDLLGRVTLEGWAVDERSLSLPGAVLVEVDGVVHEATMGQSRGDVARALGEPAYERCGFGVTLPLAPGTHEVAVVAQDLSGRRRHRSETRLLEVTSPGIVIVVDTIGGVPLSGAPLAVRTNPLGRVVLRGWAVDGADRLPARGLTVRLDGQAQPPPRAARREDVATFHDEPGYAAAGFEAELAMPAGDHRLEITAQGADGSRAGRWGPVDVHAIHPALDDAGRDLGPALARTLARRHETAVSGIARPPLISVLTPVYDVDAEWLSKAIDSVVHQAYPHWELCLVDDGSRRAHVAAVLHEYAAADARVKVTGHVTNQGVCAASNTALALARGDYVALLDHDDELAPEALLEVAKVLDRDPATDMVYTDECIIAPTGEVMRRDYKPDWSPDTLLSHLYTSHLCVLRRSLVEAIGGFRRGYEGSQDYDLVLRAVRRGARVAHVARILYRWRAIPTSVVGAADAKPYAEAAAMRALRDHVAAIGASATVERGLEPHTYRVRYDVSRQVPVAILIAARRCRDVERTAATLGRRTGYRPHRVYVLYDPEVEPRPTWGDGDAVVALACPDGLLSAAMLSAVAEEHVALVDAAAVPRHPGWLSALVEHLQHEPIGVVGGRLPVSDEPGTSLQRRLRERTVHNAAHVDSACLLTRKEILTGYGRAKAPGSMSAADDAAYGRFVRDSGWRVVFTPFACPDPLWSALEVPVPDRAVVNPA